MTSSTQRPLARTVVSLLSGMALWLGSQVRAGAVGILGDTWNSPPIVTRRAEIGQEGVSAHAAGADTPGRAGLDAGGIHPLLRDRPARIAGGNPAAAGLCEGIFHASEPASGGRRMAGGIRGEVAG